MFSIWQQTAGLPFLAVRQKLLPQKNQKCKMNYYLKLMMSQENKKLVIGLKSHQKWDTWHWGNSIRLRNLLNNTLSLLKMTFQSTRAKRWRQRSTQGMDAVPITTVPSTQRTHRQRTGTLHPEIRISFT